MSFIDFFGQFCEFLELFGEEVVHGWSHTSANPQECSRQTKTDKNIFRFNWPIQC